MNDLFLPSVYSFPLLVFLRKNSLYFKIQYTPIKAGAFLGSHPAPSWRARTPQRPVSTFSTLKDGPRNPQTWGKCNTESIQVHLMLNTTASWVPSSTNMLFLRGSCRRKFLSPGPFYYSSPSKWSFMLCATADTIVVWLLMRAETLPCVSASLQGSSNVPKLIPCPN